MYRLYNSIKKASLLQLIKEGERVYLLRFYSQEIINMFDDFK